MNTPTFARVEATLRQSVTAGSGPKAGNVSPTHQHIPGAVLRGACAAEWITRFGPPQLDPARGREFTRIFEDEGVFGPLHSEASRPVPLSVRRHKYQPRDWCARDWWDEALGDGAPARCPDCDQDLERTKEATMGTVLSRTRTHTAMTADDVPEEGGLFTRRALAAGQTLIGWVSGTAVEAFHPNGQTLTTLRLGGKRSTNGLTEVQIRTDVQPDPVECDGTHLVLRLASPGVFIDGYGLPTDAPDPAEITGVLGVPLELLKPWARWGQAAGWHIASGLPKPTERVVVAGSTYRYRCTSAPSDDALRALAVRGLGLRRREGFGALYRCPPPERVRTVRSLEPVLRPLRDWPALPRLLPSLRARPASGGPGDDHHRRVIDSGSVPPPIADGLRAVLSVRNDNLYRLVLTYLETGAVPA